MINDLLPQDENLQPEDENRNADYVFADGSLPSSEQLDAFIEEFQQIKEEKNAPNEPTPEELEAELVIEDPDGEDISYQTARNTAQFVVSTVDDLAAKGLAYIAKEKADDFRAGKEQKKNLENIITKLCKEKGKEIPLPVQIGTCIFTMYLAQVPYALDRRKINDQLKEIEQERKNLEKEREELLKERELFETQRKLLREIKDDLENAK